MTPDAFDPAAVPLDLTAREALATQGLAYVTVDPGEEDSAPFTRWAEAVDRGFLAEQAPAESIEGWRRRSAGRRHIAVLDPGAARPDQPVATTCSWVGELTVDIGRTLDAWAISNVTVSATHRRRGIARALIEGDLRAAAAAGLAVAALTVSEATIYPRYGFGPAVPVTRWTVDARRAGWLGPEPVREGRGRLDVVERETIRTDARELFERVRLTRPGELRPTASLYLALSGLLPGRPNLKARGVRFTDAEGVVRGLLVHQVEGNRENFAASTLTVDLLLAETPDAYAALWHFALTHDLIGTVKAGELSMDEPLRWMVADQRALTVTEHDHHWLRILDVPRALAARHYRVPGALVLGVVDGLGITGGTFRLEIDDDGAARVTAAPDAAEIDLRLGIGELSALYLGGVSARTLLAAGRIECEPAVATWFDTAFAPAAPPRLSYWY